MNRICKKCNIEKHINEFGKNSKYKDGLQVICKECVNRRMTKNHTYSPRKVLEKEGSSDLLDVKVVSDILAGITKLFTGRIKNTKPSFVYRIKYDIIPTESKLKTDIRSITSLIDEKVKHSSNISVQDIDIKEDSDGIYYEYSYAISIGLGRREYKKMDELCEYL